MRYLTIGSAALNQTPLEWDGNKANIVSAIEAARLAGVFVLCLPELCIPGYGCEDAFLSVANCQLSISILHEIAPSTKGMVVAVGLPILFRDGLYNTACLLADGEIVGFAAKQHLAGDGVHYEPRWFKPWQAGHVSEINMRNMTYPIGDLIFEINDLRIGFEICEDAWAATRTGISLASRGVDLILNPSASHFAMGKYKVRKRFVQEGARAFGVGYVYANLLGNEAGRMIYDGDTYIATADGVVAEGERFSFQDYILTTTDLDIHDLRIYRAGLSSFPKIKGNGSVVYFKRDLSLPMALQAPFRREGLEEERKLSREEELCLAITLGLFDYLRKSHMKGYVINLSGGADSAANASLVYLMIKRGMMELGEEKFKEKLKVKSVEPKDLLFCLYQKTENNTPITENAATELAKAFGASFADLAIQPLVHLYQDLIEGVVGIPLTWEKDDIALQNIQSRVRCPSAWFLANIKHFILLCCSNRSEAGVGYGTMDGDMAGGLSPLAGVNKSTLLKWLKWLETKGLKQIGPFPFLKFVTGEQPTAELKPFAFQQTDERDLMPYDKLDIIESLFVRDKRSPLEILNLLKKQFPEEDPKVFANYVECFFKLFAKNQWKRERLPPSFHLDDENVDPRSWCRFPILSGEFKRELKLMWSSLKA